MTQRNPVDYTHDEIIHTCEAMIKFGGSFTTHIACAALHADSYNKETLLKAFAALFYKYGPESDFYKA